MNFDFLTSVPDLEKLSRYCYEAEHFAFDYPDVSLTAARKAMEYLVKVLYGTTISRDMDGMTIYDMLSDPRFTAWLDDPGLLRRMHAIRQMGNQAVHQGGMTQEHALAALANLHAVVSAMCLRLGLIASCPPFDPQLRREAPEDEPTVEASVITRLAGRLRNVFDPSQLRGKAELVDHFTSTKALSALKKQDPAMKATDTAGNSRAAFQFFAEYLAERLGAENVLADYRELQLHITTGKKRIVLAVRTACCRLAVKSALGEWLYLPGIDYVLYTDKLDPAVPLLEQFRVFTAKEFLDLWQGIKHVRPTVSSGTSKRLKQVLGADVRISIDDYADELRIQTLTTAHRNKKQTIAETLAMLPLLEGGGLEKLLDPS
ncbi:MAG: DUF4145 domain-containing protein [Clostridia bacterium]|nr:DUF4145 domain-containing protein [Clostridia bacterium]